jgi:capsular exopolysaccharide synthesis family protein
MEKNNRKLPAQKEESLFVKMMNKYLAYWPIFLLFLVFSSGLAYVYILYASPKYEARASLIIKDEKKGNDDSKLMESLNMINAKKIIENEIEVLQSRPIIDNVVNKLHLYAPVFQESKFNSLSAYQEAPLTIESFNPGLVKKVKEKLYLKYDSLNGIVFINNQPIGPINEWLTTTYGKFKFSPNEKYNISNNQYPYYFNLLEVKEAAENLLRNLKVTASNKLSSVINLSYRDYKTNLAEDVLNELIIAYNNEAITEKNALAIKTLSLIEERLNIVGGDLSAIEQKIQQYKAGSEAVDISTQGQLFLQNVSANDQKLSDVNMQLSVINQLENHILTNNSNVGISPSTLGVSDPTLSQLLNSLNTAELEREKLKKTVAENNPLLVSVTDQINKIKPNIIDNIQSQRNNLEANKKYLAATNSRYSNMLHSIPVKERQLLEISRDQNIKSGIYSFLLQKREESELSYASNLSDTRVVNYAQSSNSPVSPNKLIILAAIIIATFGLPIALINTMETFSPTILYRNEIEALTSIPIIGELGYNKSKKQLLIEAGKRSFIAEEFRKIRFSLQYLGIDSTHNKILLTSSISGEGKSFISANLAISFSLTGKKVALVDLDLHNASLGKIFSKDKEPGVCDYLIGNKSLEEIINPVLKYDNLFFISSGGIQQDPSELLENGMIEDMISRLGERFDVLIIDTAPIVLVTDAHVLSASCNTTLYVVRHKFTPKILLKRFDDNNEVNPLTNPAIIFNGVKKRGYLSNNSGYGYGYTYGDKSKSRMLIKNKAAV